MRVHIIVVVRPVLIYLKTFTAMCLLCADTVCRSIKNYITSFYILKFNADFRLVNISGQALSHCSPLSSYRELTIAGKAKGERKEEMKRNRNIYFVTQLKLQIMVLVMAMAIMW